MTGSTFKTNPDRLRELLQNFYRGIIQLPDFQRRSWVWDQDWVKNLIASVFKAFPVGALMTLETGGGVDFKSRPVEGAAAEAEAAKPSSLLLDGQQRMTSLYQVGLRGKVVEPHEEDGIDADIAGADLTMAAARSFKECLPDGQSS